MKKRKEERGMRNEDEKIYKDSYFRIKI